MKTFTLNEKRKYSMNLEKLPKTELHHHLELSFTWPELYAMAQEDGSHEGMDLSAFEKHFALTEPSENLGEVLHKFLGPARLLNQTHRLKNLVSGICKRAQEQNIKLLELRYTPSFLGDLNQMQYEEIHKGILAGLPKPTSEFAVGLIGIFQRTKSEETNNKVLEFFQQHKNDFIGFDLADDEDKFDTKIFAPLFKEVSLLGKPITIHAGEVPGDISIRNVKDSIYELGAKRIGHGVQSINDPEAIKLLIKEDILLEVCPTSNWLTQATEKLEDHPIRRLLDAGVKLSINTDDPGVFSLDLINEYKVCRDLFEFTESEFNQTNLWAMEFSFIDENHKKSLKGHFA